MYLLFFWVRVGFFWGRVLLVFFVFLFFSKMKINLLQELLSVDNNRLEHKAIFLCPRGNIYHHGPDTCTLAANTPHACLRVDHPPAQLQNASCLLFRTRVKAKPSSTSQKAEEGQLVQMLKFWWERQTINRFPKRSALGQSYLAIPLIPLIGKVGDCDWNLQTTYSWESLSTQRMGRSVFRTFED